MDQIVFTLNSLQDVVSGDEPVHSILSAGPSASADVVTLEEDGTLYVIHRSDGADARRLVVMLRDGRIWPKDVNPAEHAMLERMLRLGFLADRMPLRVPPAWASYKSGNLVAFYACGRALGVSRWIAEVRLNAQSDVCFWCFYAASENILLDRYRPPEDRYELAIAGWDSAFSAAQSQFAQMAPAVEVDPAAGFDLMPGSFADVAENRRRSEWMPKLTPQQRAFVLWPVDHSVKLRGPAGSGKTLALELKALHEIEEAQNEGKTPRVLFVTHSWALAEEVDADVSSLCGFGVPDELTIMPLLAVAQDLQPDAWRSSGRELVGEDSLSGKTAVLDRIEAVVEKFLLGDWLTFRDEVSQALRARLESKDPDDRKALVWDCMVEFGCVLGADGIFPGIGAVSRYLHLPRTAWMMPLQTDADKRLVLALYYSYMDELEASGELTSDQLMTDFLGYLEGHDWNARRVKDGYDLIFVDEFHLFNTQERHLLRYLVRSTRNDYPKILMALDPKQSPWAIYSGLADASPASSPEDSSSEGAEDDFGQVSSMDLATVHRFSPEILQLVQHLDWEVPALDLGADWGPGMSTVTSSAEEGPVPVVVRCGSQAAEVTGVYEAVRSHKAAGPRGQVAIAVVDQGKFGRFQEMAESLARSGGLKVSIIAGREDTEIFQYRRRGVILGPAEYLAGLQFDSVIVAGLPEEPAGTNVGYRRKRYLSLLYLAITRARREVRIFVNEDYGGVPEFLQTGGQRGVLRLEKGPQA